MEERRPLTREDFCNNLFSRCPRGEKERVLCATSDPTLDDLDKTPSNCGPKLFTSKDKGRKKSCDTGSLQDIYVCSLTQQPCVARRIKVHVGEIPGWDYAYAEVSYFYQRRCPGFNS